MHETSIQNSANPTPFPDVAAERCAHTLVIAASCTACVDRCPEKAWRLTDNGLGLDVDRCDGCGLCVPTCPTFAISLPDAGPLIPTDAPEMALAACVRSGVSGPGVISCLHRLAFDDLAALYHRGVRVLKIARADCASCSRGRVPVFDRDLATLDALLGDRTLAPLAVEHIDAQAWRAARDAAAVPSRRAFFSARRATPAMPARAQQRPGASLLARPARGPVVFRHLPVIDQNRCDVCHACARICPTGAIAHAAQQREAPAAYVLDGDLCTACELCVDICDRGAVSVRHETVADSAPCRLDIDEKQCRSCGVVFGSWVSDEADRHLCRICEKTRHSRNNFQVLG